MYKHMLLAAALPLILTISLPAQPLLTVTMSSAGFNCATSAGAQTFNVSSYSMSFDTAQPAAPPHPIKGGGGTAGNLVVNKVDDACSPILFNLVATGTQLKTVSLTDNVTHRTITLSGVVLESDRYSFGETNQLPESLSLSFQSIRFSFNGQVACYEGQTKSIKCP